MQASPQTRATGRVLIDHLRAEQPNVTHVKGLVLANSLEVLKQSGHFERYRGLLAEPFHDAVLYAIAASWVPIEAAVAHYEACDQLMLSDAELEQSGTRIAQRVAETFLGTVFRTTRKAGMESFWFVVKQSDRFWERAYQGGGCTVIQTGPKDVIVEWHGLPLVKSRHFRVAQRFYTRGLASLFCSRAFVKTVPPRTPHPHRLATSISWV